MTPAEARALIAEGRVHDEAMTHGPWTASDAEPSNVGGPPGSAQVRCDAASARVPSGCLVPFFVLWHGDAAGIAWMRTNLSRLLDGYTEALEEIERLQSTQCPACDGDCERLHGDGLMHRCTVCGGTGRRP